MNAAPRSWSYYAPDYLRVLRAFRNGPRLVLNHHQRTECAGAVLWDGTRLRGPDGRKGLTDTIVEIWGGQPYTAGFYEPRNGDAILDIGANVGLFSLWVAQRAPGARVTALEPFPENFAILQRNLAGRPTAVRAYPFACGPAAGTGRMVDGGSRSLDHRLAPADGNTTAHEVRVVTLAEAVELVGVPAVDLLKMDIEGGEHDIFATPPPAALMRRVRRIAVEYHDNLRAGTLTLIKERLAASHRVFSVADSAQGYGILRAALAA